VIRGRAAAAASLAALFAAGCSARDTIAVTGSVGDDLPGYCEGSGPPVLVDGTCSGELAEDLFRHAVCGCGGLAFGGRVTTDGFDSRIAPYAPGGLGGDVASNVGVDGNQEMDIGGGLEAGGDGIEAGPVLRVAGDLISGGPLGRSSSAIEVGGSARVAGDVDVQSLAVGGTLTTRPGAVVVGEVSAAAEESAEISVPPPCRCEDALDVAAVIDEHELLNHDAELGLEPDALEGIEGDLTLELPCGRFYLGEVRGDGAGTVTVRATGRTALFVGGNLTLGQDLVVEVAPGAELDLFVAGNIQVSGRVTLGDPTRPRALRLYVASGGSIALPSGSTLAGNLHAPRADIASSASLEVYGALVANRVNSADAVTVHHDRAVADASDACTD
jgi:hypothetical protein